MNDLDFLRLQIDDIDTELLKLLAKRQKIVGKIGEYKKVNNIDALQPNRWDEVLKSRKKQARNLGLDEKVIENIWNEIHRYSLKIEKK